MNIESINVGKEKVISRLEEAKTVHAISTGVLSLSIAGIMGALAIGADMYIAAPLMLLFTTSAAANVATTKGALR